MGLQEFDGSENNKDNEYLDWMSDNPEGFVGNFAVGEGDAYFCLHKAGCYHIAKYTRCKRPNSFTTGLNIKVCSNRLDDILAWAKANRQKAIIRSCKTCNPPSSPRSDANKK